MSKPLKSFYEASKYLGQYIGAKPEMKFLLDTSCMSPERRRQLAVLEAVFDFMPVNTDFKQFYDDFLKKLMQKLGLAEWARDTVTDMAIRKGLTSESESLQPEEIIIDDTPDAEESS